MDLICNIKAMAGKVLIAMMLTAYACMASAQTDRQCIREGNRLFHRQQFDKAEVFYRKAIAKNPSNPQAIYNLGCALMMQNKDSAAVVQYQNAAKIERNKMRLSKVYHNIGVICQNRQIYGDAIAAYEQALRNNPKDDETRYNLVLCKRLQKKQPPKKQNRQQQKKQEKKQDDEKNKDKDENKNERGQQPQQHKEQMSKDNAEQLLNAAMQSEQATQQRLRKAMRQPSSRKLQKNW